MAKTLKITKISSPRQDIVTKEFLVKVYGTINTGDNIHFIYSFKKLSDVDIFVAWANENKIIRYI